MSAQPSPSAPSTPLDYHGHPSYPQVYGALVILLVLSLLAPLLFPLKLAVLLIFLSAGVKAWLVIANFMHLRYEPRLLWLAVGVVAFVFLAFLLGVYPDIPLIPLEPFSS